ncbi:MAG: serine hydrolase domain-containing protein [Pseudomonadales bacterium]
MRLLTQTLSVVLLAAMFAPTGANADTLKMVKPESVGMSSAALKRIDQFAQKKIESGTHTGFVSMVARHGKIVHFEATGKMGLDNDAPIKKDTLFRIYSMTKPVTAVAAMMLYEEGYFQLSDPISKYMPEFKDLQVFHEDGNQPAQSEITIEHLLTHTAGFSYGFDNVHPVNKLYNSSAIFEAPDLTEFTKKLAQLPLRYEPGTRYYYSVATDVLGALVERVSGQPLDTFFQQRIFEPLGMNDTFFSVPADKLDRLATNHVWDYENNEIALVPVERRRSYENVSLFSGGGGLVSTAMDYMRFCEMLRAGGRYNGARLLGPKTVQYMSMNQLSDEVRNEGADEYPAMHLYPGQSFGLGFGVITEPGMSQVVSSKGEYSWGGAADTKFWIDPEEDLVVVLMTQLLRAPGETRYQIKVATYQALDTLGAKQ